MSGKLKTIIAIAVSNNRIAMVFLIDKQPMDWEVSYVAAASIGNAANKVTEWIDHYSADIVVTENLCATTRKGRRTRHLQEAVENAAVHSRAQHIDVLRHQPFPSKYEQIDDLVVRYPQLKAIAPLKRKYWENEPHVVTIFEAMALAEKITRS